MVEMSSEATAVTIRAIEPADADAVSRLAFELGYRRSPAQIREWIEELRRTPREQAAFVAVLENEIAGWIDISIERRLQSPPFAFIGGLVVKDGSRNRGIGRRLCAHAEAWAWQRGVETVRVTSRSTRAAAHRFYLRDGYKEVKTSLVFEKTRPPN
jgi:GNAT superfamily N-acetyltransferase